MRDLCALLRVCCIAREKLTFSRVKLKLYSSLIVGVTDHMCIYACVVLLFVQKWYLHTLLTIVLYFTRLALLLERYIQQLDCVL